MRGFSGALAVTVAALLVYCKADPPQEQDVGSSEHHSGNGYKARTLDSIGGGNMVRQVPESRHPPWVPYMILRQMNDYNSPIGGRDRYMYSYASPQILRSLQNEEMPKRNHNFDEIDRSELDTFITKRRNFDEIDLTSMPFPYYTGNSGKRNQRSLRRNYFENVGSYFDKKRNRAEFPMDEIDLSHLPVGSKRSFDNYPLLPRVLR